MGQRHVADAERRIDPQQPQIVVDHVAALHAHQRRDLVLGRRLAHLRGGRRQHEVLRIRPHGFAHRVDLIERALDRRRTGDVAGHPDREEQRIEATFAHARDVDVPVLVARGEIEGLVEDESLRGVVVRVDDDRAIVQLLRPSGHLVACGSLCEDQDWQQHRTAADRAHEKMSHAAILSQRCQTSASPQPLAPPPLAVPARESFGEAGSD